MGDGNYLYSTFTDRIKDVEGLTEKEKSDYIQDNALAVNNYIFPAYEKLLSAIGDMEGRAVSYTHLKIRKENFRGIT